MKLKALLLFSGLFLSLVLSARGQRLPPDWDNALIEAIEDDNTAEVQAILAKGLRDSDRCRRTESAVSAAAEQGNIEIIKALFAAGAKLVEQDCPDSSPLWEASQQGHAEVVAFLLSMKADVHFKAGNGSTPLLSAISGPLIEKGPKGDVGKTAELLLDAGSDPNVENKFGQTPLSLAVRKADARLVSLLLDHKAMPDRKNKNGLSALDTARKEGLAFIASLLEGRQYPKPSASGQKLLDAAAAGDAETAALLLASGESVDVLDSGGNTPLIHAAYNGKEELGLMLLKAGAAPMVKNGRNDTALHFAGARGLSRLAAALIDRGANPVAADYYGNSSLSYSVREGKTETAALLLSRGANPDEKDEKGMTLLMEMAGKGDGAMVRALLDGKASYAAADSEGFTALMYAAKEGRREAVEALLKAGADASAKDAAGRTALHLALEEDHEDIAALLAAKGVKPDQGALLTALRNWQVLTVKSLLNQGVSPNPDPDGDVPLMLAAGAYEVKSQLIELLLKAGAKPDVSDGDGSTPLMAAAKFSGEDSVKAVKLLLKAGADYNVRDRKGMTAWTHAMLNGSNDTAEVLAKAGAAREYDALSWEGSFLKDSSRFAKAITDQEEWDGLWKKLEKDPIAPVIDFKNYAVVCVSLGRIPGPDTMGVAIKKPVLEDTILRVDFKVVPRGYITDVSATSPYAILVVKRSGAKNIVLPPVPELSKTGDLIGQQKENPVEY